MNRELVLRRIRAHPALWGDLGPVKEAQAIRIRDRCKQSLAPQWKARADQVEHERGQRLLYTWA